MPDQAEPHLLESMLAVVLRGVGEARELLHAAVVSSGRSAPPSDPVQIIAFARAHLIERLAAMVGPRVALRVLDDLRQRLGAVSDTTRQPAPDASSSTAARTGRYRPTSVTDLRRSGKQTHDGRVLVVDPDAFMGASLARELVRSDLRVDVCAELGEARLRAGSFSGVAAMLRRADAAVTITRALSALAPRIAIIGADLAVAELRVAVAGHGLRAEIVPLTTPVRVIAGLLLDQLSAPVAVNES